MIDRTASVGTRIESETNAAASNLITGVFYRYETIGRPFIRRSVGVHVRVRLVFRGQRLFRPMPLGGGIGPTLAGPRIFMEAKVKLVAYGVHLLIKYLLTKGNT